MADNAEGAGEAQITFKVKTGGDKVHTLTMSEAATVLELKNRLAGEDLENVPVERQRLIYSGRVMKNDDTLESYKIKPNNTIHMVKSAASNPTPQSASSSAGPARSSTPSAIPTNMAAGVANNPLAGLTGARYAGHINLPSREMFGADGGMGAPPSDDQMAQMLSDPTMMQTMNAALDNPQFIDYMIQSNPQLRNMPNAREIIQSPFMRQMMTNPDMLRNVMRMQRNMMGGQGASPFPAPGATDTTPADAAASGNDTNTDNNNNNSNNNQPPNPFAFPPMPAFPGGGGGGGGDINSILAQLNSLNALLGAQGAGAAPAAAAPGASPGADDAQGSSGTTAGTGTTGTPAANTTSQSPPPANPFAALFAPPPNTAQAQNQGQGQPANPFGQITPEMMQQAIGLWGLGGGGGGGGFGFGGGLGGAASPASPPDNRPPEERYAEQLRQLNDMGFYDFDRNVAALRRSGGSVQGAVEHLLGGS
ncbi:hypothetical protein SODALDRAFT_320040 [Sodiomyces alkalinus F11]|uniref:Ubiquitin-domain-containing protein n=1 Tax=Sodiomyces alkalinus (strain CBS 110278 / VKM F-3762 / F11) TaxID=1314773 RepID=A0A3N2QA43_SODAK|nr:hypothetical protein SODALDRAFT_320040 [Sodiomyces alkalinus F11]ROT43620.1 hypothetical protein SODALDRAFT_320040 [Sodiomyces alkalinus F11]